MPIAIEALSRMWGGTETTQQQIARLADENRQLRREVDRLEKLKASQLEALSTVKHELSVSSESYLPRWIVDLVNAIVKESKP